MVADSNFRASEINLRNDVNAEPDNSSNVWMDAASESYKDFRSYFSGINSEEHARANRKYLNDIGAEDVDAEVYWDWAQKNFDVLDANKDGFVNLDELSDASHNPAIPALKHGHLHALHFAYSELQSSHNDELGFENDGFTRLDLLEHQKSAYATSWIIERNRPSRWNE